MAPRVTRLPEVGRRAVRPESARHPTIPRLRCRSDQPNETSYASAGCVASARSIVSIRAVISGL